MTQAARKPAIGALRPIRREDNAAVAAIIREVMPQFGCVGEGFAINDPEVDYMYETYQLPRSAYFVIEQDGMVAGGGGVAPLKGGDADVCEIQKFYILPACRGYGYGKQLLDECLRVARAQGFKRCYLETMESMDAAAALYTNAGFAPIDRPMGSTGHFSCNRWYLKAL